MLMRLLELRRSKLGVRTLAEELAGRCVNLLLRSGAGGSCMTKRSVRPATSSDAAVIAAMAQEFSLKSSMPVRCLQRIRCVHRF